MNKNVLYCVDFRLNALCCASFFHSMQLFLCSIIHICSLHLRILSCPLFSVRYHVISIAVKCIEDNRLFAIKTIFTEKESEMKDTLREVRFLRMNRHPCIIDVHDGFMTAQPRILFIVMPYCEGGDLDALIKNTKKSKQFLPEDRILRWSIQIGLAMHFLHENGVVHRDLKPNNIMLTEGGDLIKVVDFGLAMSMKEVRTVTYGTVT